MFKNTKRTLEFCFSGLFFFSSVALANVDHSGYKFSLYGGWQKNTLKPSSFILAGNENEELAPNHRNATEPTYGLGVAYRFLTPHHEKLFRFTHDVSLGLDMLYFQTKQRGAVFDYGESNDFNYLLHIHSLRFMGNIEWTFLPVTSQRIYPFLEAGAGLVSNTNSYTDAPNSGVSTGVGTTFAKYSVIQLAYDAGAGLKWMPSNNIEISARYLFSSLGMARSGTNASLPVIAPYNVPLRTQSIVLGLSYLLDK